MQLDRALDAYLRHVTIERGSRSGRAGSLRRGFLKNERMSAMADDTRGVSDAASKLLDKRSGPGPARW